MALSSPLPSPVRSMEEQAADAQTAVPGKMGAVMGSLIGMAVGDEAMIWNVRHSGGLDGGRGWRGELLRR